jgi:hypothetical protein
MIMEVNLHAASLWDAIEDKHVTRKEEKQAQATLLSSTPLDMQCICSGKGSAEAVWEAIHVQYQGSERMRDSRLWRLRAEFETITFKDGKPIDEFSMHTSNIAVWHCAPSTISTMKKRLLENFILLYQLASN